MDILSKEQRSRCMSAIRGRNTKPEMVVRRLVHSMGFRYRLHRRDLPGAPDLTFPRLRKIIFVHGCFWHRHDCPLGSPIPRTRAAFWANKFRGNVERDARNSEALRALGWKILTVWECEVRGCFPEKLAGKLKRFLSSR